MTPLDIELNEIIEEAHKNGWTEELEIKFLKKGEEELLSLNEKLLCTSF